jgi:hypothetical protein
MRCLFVQKVSSKKVKKVHKSSSLKVLFIKQISKKNFLLDFFHDLDKKNFVIRMYIFFLFESFTRLFFFIFFII